MDRFLEEKGYTRQDRGTRQRRHWRCAWSVSNGLRRSPEHDAADAEAICEAVGRPTMRFVPVKTADQQAAVLLHRGRERLVRQRTGLVNALRGHLAEFGVIAPSLRTAGRSPERSMSAIH